MERGNSMGKCMEVWARVAYREMLVLAVTRTRVAQDISAYGNVVVVGGIIWQGKGACCIAQLFSWS